MKNKKFFILTVFFIGFILNISTELIKIYFSLPAFLYSNIVGTVLVSVSLGPLWGAAAASIPNLLLNNIGMGNPAMNILVLIKFFEGILAGVINWKHKYTIKNVLVTSVVLTIVIPFVGAMLTTYLFKDISGTGSAFLKNFFMDSIVSYKLLVSKRFFDTLFNYATSCIIAFILITSAQKISLHIKDKLHLNYK